LVIVRITSRLNSTLNLDANLEVSAKEFRRQGKQRWG
jgi:hypothetical protein